MTSNNFREQLTREYDELKGAIETNLAEYERNQIENKELYMRLTSLAERMELIDVEDDEADQWKGEQ